MATRKKTTRKKATKRSAQKKKGGAGKKVSAAGDADIVERIHATDEETIDRITGMSPSLLDYTLSSVTAGKEALGEVSVRIEWSGRTFSGRGASTDIIEASAKAYLRAVNRLVAVGGDEPG